MTDKNVRPRDNLKKGGTNITVHDNKSYKSNSSSTRSVKTGAHTINDGNVLSEKLKYDAYKGYNIGLDCLESDEEKAEDCFEKALLARIELSGENHVDTVDVRENLGDIKIGKDIRSAAVIHYKTAFLILNTNKKTGDIDRNGKKFGSKIRIGSKLANALFELHFINGTDDGRDEALELYTKIIPLRVKHGGGNDENVIRMLYNLGKLFLKKEDYSNALVCFNDVLESRRYPESDNMPVGFFGSLLFEAGLASEKNGELRKAENYYKELLHHIEASAEVGYKKLLHHIKSSTEVDYKELLHQIETSQEVDQLYVMHRLSCVLLDSNKFEEALPYLERLLVAVEEGKAGNMLERNVLDKLAIVHTKMGSYEEAINMYEKRCQLFDTSRLHEEEEIMKDVYISLGDLYKKMGQQTAAIRSYERVIQIQHEKKEQLGTYNNLAMNKSEKDIQIKQAKKEQEATVRTVNNIAICCFKDEMYDRALGACEYSLNQNSAETEELVMEQIKTYTTMGSIYQRRSDFVNSAKYYEVANELHESFPGGDKNMLCITLTNLGIVSYKAYKLEEARTIFHKALNLQTILSGGNSLEVAKIQSLIGKVFLKEKNYCEALSYYRQAYETEKFAATDYAIVCTVEKIGNLHFKMKDNSLAIIYLEKALALKRKLKIEVGNLLSLLCTACINSGDLEKAFFFAQAAWRKDKRKDGEYHEHTLNSWGMIARVKSLKGDHIGALSDYEEILNTKRNEMRTVCPDESKAVTLMDIGYVCLMMGKYSKSHENFNEAKNILLRVYGDEQHGHPSIKRVEKYISDLNEKSRTNLFSYYVDWTFS